jgi:4-amino-4-deoxy-L-arabinose transferase-like glycosyltransferase
MGFFSNTRALYRCAAVLIVCVAVGRITSTYGRLTQTIDESSHLDCGMQLLQGRVYDIEIKHGPLARVFIALGPYLAGLRRAEPARRRVDEIDTYAEGNALLYANNNYWHNLALARIGTMPFFLLACVVVWFWSARIADERAALLALLLFILLPPVLGHAGLATTDMGATATLVAALYCLTLWMEKPSCRAAALFGAAAGFAIVCKLSAALFLPGAAVILLLLYFATGADALRRRPLRKTGGDILVALAAMYLAMWAGYLFTLYPAQPPHSQIRGDRLLAKVPPIHDAVHAFLESPLPAGQVPGGLRDLAADNRGGHTQFFLGEWKHSGWWYFFPVLFLVKTPLPFLLLCGVGVFVLTRSFRKDRDWRKIAPVFLPAVILGLAMLSNINIGLRHVLAIYPLLSIVAGCAAAALWASLRHPLISRAMLAGMLVCLAGSGVLVHPEYLAYFNWFALGHPERIEVDSDLDWGQDLAQLSGWLRAAAVKEVAISYFGRADLDRANLPRYYELPPNQRVTGWVAISAYNRTLPAPFHVRRLPGIEAPYYSVPWNFEKLPHEPGPFSWLKAYQPVARIGQSIFVYNIASQ